MSVTPRATNDHPTVTTLSGQTKPKSNTAKINEFRAFCAARGWSTPATALAWVLSRGPHLIPIPGTRSAAHLRQFAQGAEIVLTAEDHAEINRILPAGFAYGDRYADHQTQAIERYC
jgi:aryl-alcohol dehydrogenase-like predicted oxidoreductase